MPGLAWLNHGLILALDLEGDTLTINWFAIEKVLLCPKLAAYKHETTSTSLRYWVDYLVLDAVYE